MTPFDPIKAQREILTGLVSVYTVLLARTRDAERRHGEAEDEYNALAKLERFVVGLVADAREKLKRLETEARTQGKMGSPP